MDACETRSPALPALLLGVLLACPGSGKEITYAMLAESAARNSLQLQLYRTDVQIAESALESRYAEYYPTVALGFSNEYREALDGGDNGLQSVGDTVISGGTLYQSTIALNLNYELYRFGATGKSVAIAGEEVRIRRLQWCAEESALRRSILEHYTAALKAENEHRFRLEMAALRRESYDHLKRLHAAGKASKIDLGEEAMKMIELERAAETAKSRYDDEVSDLSRLSHMEMEADGVTLGPIETSGDAEPAGFDATPEGMRLEAALRQKEAEISMLKRSQLPVVSLYSNYYAYGASQESIDGALDAMGEKSWSAGFHVRMNLFEGFKFRSESQRLELELRRITEERALRAREYAYEEKMLLQRMAHSRNLEREASDLVERMEAVDGMSARLRKHEEIDALAHLNRKHEMLERSLQLQTERIDAAYERAALALHYRGADRCTLH